jgi:two-component system sensor histidine kinase/response regulator
MSTNDKIKVLIVEDDREDYLLAKHYLSNIENMHFIVEGESDYLKALHRISQKEHDVYLIDYSLGGNNGVELVKQARNSGIMQPFIFLTGMDSRKVDMEALEVGATDFLLKENLKQDMLERSIRYAIKQKETENKLKEANATKDKLFSIISHDLRSPLGALNRMLELLSKGNIEKSDDTYQDLLDELHHTSNQTYNLLDNLLIWSKAQIGAVAINPELIDVESLFNEMISLFESQSRFKQINIQLAQSRSINLFTDKSTLHLIFRNLIANAIKFTPDNGTITLGAEKYANEYLFYVKDSGIGIEPEMQKRIFNNNLFYTTEGTKKRKRIGIRT